MGYERFFYHIFKFFLVFNPFFLDPDPYIFLLDPDSYQSSSWIQIRIKVRPGSGSVTNFCHILDPDPYRYQKDTDPPHCLPA